MRLRRVDGAANYRKVSLVIGQEGQDGEQHYVYGTGCVIAPSAMFLC
jgi:hypothetical protein